MGGYEKESLAHGLHSPPASTRVAEEEPHGMVFVVGGAGVAISALQGHTDRRGILGMDDAGGAHRAEVRVAPDRDGANRFGGITFAVRVRSQHPAAFRNAVKLGAVILACSRRNRSRRRKPRSIFPLPPNSQSREPSNGPGSEGISSRPPLRLAVCLRRAQPPADRPTSRPSGGSLPGDDLGAEGAGFRAWERTGGMGRASASQEFTTAESGWGRTPRADCAERPPSKAWPRLATFD